MSKGQTDNTYFYDKVAMRINHLPVKKNITVLDAYCGENKIWKTIEKQTNKNIKIVPIDIKNKKGIYLKGDNIKYMMAMDLSRFDIIDLDAYGVPYHQLKLIFKTRATQKIKCTVFVTFNQTVFGQLPKNFLKDLGYTSKMVKKCPSLFNVNGLDKMIQYLALNGIKKIYLRSKNRINYFCFKI